MKKTDHHAEIDLFIGGFFSGFDSRHRRTPSVHTAEKTVIARSIGGQCGVPAFMKYLLMIFAFASSCASAEMFKCFDGVRP
ncbi:MAG: hypothetical protein K2Q15_08440, partial [Burkholderiales bacterium]|nr:hypothetical protein [Burkholderiales bacterium]